MKLKAKFGDLVVEVETENEDRALALFGYWYGLVAKAMADDAPPPKKLAETHH